ncbi:MAG: hypothetical protein AB7P07_02605 [Hyphomonadaceae bacterium]
MADAGRVPVKESVGAALQFLRADLRTSATLAIVGGLLLTLTGVAATLSPALSMPLSLASTFVSAVIYAAFIGSALGAGGSQRWLPDGGRVWAAMAVVAFFLLIVFVVLGIPGVIIFAGMIAPRYGAELEQVSGDEAATLALMQRILTENPGVVLGFCLVYGAIWLMLTSRLYLSAPASVDQRRILTFETWSWTKGSMLRITVARLMLLAPAYVLVAAVSYILAAALGVDVLDPTSLVSLAQNNLPGFVAFSFLSASLQIFVYRSLEAGLSAYLYQGLKPADSAPPA